jgi:hypothetical protein
MNRRSFIKRISATLACLAVPFKIKESLEFHPKSITMSVPKTDTLTMTWTTSEPSIYLFGESSTETDNLTVFKKV